MNESSTAKLRAYFTIVDMNFDWSGCSEVEQVPGKVSGVPILVDTRVQAEGVVDNFRSGYSVAEIADMFRLQAAQVQAVVNYYLQHRPTPPDPAEELTTDQAWHAPLIMDFRRSARPCFLEGDSYNEPKDVLATEDKSIKTALRHAAGMDLSVLGGSDPSTADQSIDHADVMKRLRSRLPRS